jgi:HAE1 family hydrophobic/amphiphilic exporter-1
MNISEVFIRRPVMTTLVMVAFLLAGLVGYSRLPVSELPTIDYPTVNVQANLPGASPETMAATIATPLEKQIATIPGVDSMTSSSSQGHTTITVTFELNRNIDAAAQDVQSAVSSTGGLPTRDMPFPPHVRKANPADQPILVMRLSSKTLPLSTVNDYSENVLLRKLSTLDGVAAVDINGEQRRAVRIQVDPDALAVRGIGIDQVADAISAANVNEATGSLDGRTRAAVIQAEGLLFDSDQFAKQIVAYRDGKPVRFSDIANVVDSTSNIKNYNLYNGEPTIALQIRRQPGSNTVAVVDEVMAALPELKSQLPPSINLEVIFDRSQTIRASIDDVQWTMLFSALLVVGVIFIFLRTITATFIPSVALPISVVGAFAGMYALGFSLDNLSLMALTLSVIFIVDDAIVMLENIMRHVESGETPLNAALIGSKEVSSTILTMTVSLAAVFVPVIFMNGILGRLLHEFSLTIVTAILISGVVSVTLTPMLCSRIIRRGHDSGHAATSGKQNRFLARSEEIFNRIQNVYGQSLRWSLQHRKFIMVLFVLSLAATFYLFPLVKQDFIPAEDAGVINVTVTAANGTSFADMVRRQQEVEAIMRADPNVYGVTSSVGSFGAIGSNNGRLNLRLKPVDDRPDHHTIDQVMAELRRKTQNIPASTSSTRIRRRSGSAASRPSRCTSIRFRIPTSRNSMPRPSACATRWRRSPASSTWTATST